jgi:hypothetical protein
VDDAIECNELDWALLLPRGSFDHVSSGQRTHPPPQRPSIAARFRDAGATRRDR